MKRLRTLLRRTLARDLAVRLAVTMTIIVAMLGAAYYFLAVTQAERQLSQQANRLADELADVLSKPVWDLDGDSIAEIATAYQQTESVVGLRVLDDTGRAMYEQVSAEEKLIVEGRDVVYDGRQIGVAEIMLSTAEIRTLRRDILVLMLVIAAAVASAVAVATGLLLQRFLTVPLAELTEGIDEIAGGRYDQHLQPVGQADTDAIIEKVNLMADQIAERDRILEQQVADRTHDLEHRTRQLQAAAEVSHTVASMLSAEQLIGEVVELIRERFELYYVGMFSLDPTGQWAVLRAGTGEAGRAMLARGHQLRVGPGSMIGWCIANVQARVAQIAEDPARAIAPELPETRSEAALPLRSRDQVLGALTVQSARAQAFDQATITVLQTIADQVAVTLDNARLFSEAQHALEIERRAYRAVSREAWRELLQEQPSLGLMRNRQGVSSVSEAWQPEMEMAIQTRQTTRCGDDGRSLVIPIRVGEQVIGVLSARKAGESQGWEEDEVSLMETLTEQLSVTLESAQLYRQTQRRAAQERLTSEITARIRETLDVETVLKTAAIEIRQALGADRLLVRLGAHDEKESSPEWRER